MLVVSLSLIITILQQLVDNLLVVLACNCFVAITWYVDTVELVVELIAVCVTQTIVNWYHSYT